MSNIYRLLFAFLPFTFYLANGQLGEIKENEIPCVGRIAALKETHGFTYVKTLACSYDAISDSCFCFDKLHDRAFTFAEAKGKCVEMGGHLANIESKEQLVSLNIAAYLLFQNGRFYIGLEKIDDKWMWVHPDGNKEAGELEWFPDIAPDLSLGYGVILREDAIEVCGLFPVDCDDLYYWPYKADVVLPDLEDHGGHGRKKRDYDGYELPAYYLDYDALLEFAYGYGYTVDDLLALWEQYYYYYDYEDEDYGTFENDQPDPGTIGFGTTSGDGEDYDTFAYKFICQLPPDHEMASIIFEYNYGYDDYSPDAENDSGEDTKDHYEDHGEHSSDEYDSYEDIQSMYGYYYEDYGGYSVDQHYYEGNLEFGEYDNSSNEYHYEGYGDEFYKGDEYYYKGYDGYSSTSGSVEYYYEGYNGYISDDEYSYDDYGYDDSSPENDSGEDTKYYYEDYGYDDYSPDAENDSGEDTIYYYEGYGYDFEDLFLKATTAAAFGYYIEDYNSIGGENSQEEQNNGGHAMNMGFGVMNLITIIYASTYIIVSAG